MASGEGRIVRSNGFTALKCGEGRMVAIPLTENCRPYEDYVSEAGLRRQRFDWVIRTYITRYCTASFHLYQRLHWQGPLGQRNISRPVIFYSLLRSKLHFVQEALPRQTAELQLAATMNHSCVTKPKPSSLTVPPPVTMVFSSKSQ